MTKSPLRVALVTSQDPKLLSSWSGTQYRIYEQLKKHFAKVDPLGPPELNPFENFLVKSSGRTLPLIFRKYNKIHNLLHGFLRARKVNRQLQSGNYDFVFASACSPIAAFLKTRLPIVYLSDATFRLLLNYYQQFTGLSKYSIAEGEYAEKAAIAKSTLVLMSSDWASESAIRDYGAQPTQVRTLLFGANIEEGQVPPVPQEKIALAGKRCDLLFLARDWTRKGGQVALDAFYELKRKGYDATLTICGCEPEHHQAAEGLTVIPYLDKAKPQDRERYTQLMAHSHFLILPTVADCTPMVLAEANAYSMPVITSDTGGIGSLVKQGESGFMLPVTADGAAYADCLEQKFFADPACYQSLTVNARRWYENTLNWDNWGESLCEAVEDVVGLPSAVKPKYQGPKAHSRASL